jgi:hypothetical protein
MNVNLNGFSQNAHFLAKAIFTTSINYLQLKQEAIQTKTLRLCAFARLNKIIR